MPDLTARPMRAVFMGSAPIAVPALDALMRSADVALVVTQPDRPSGRGRHLHPTAVKAYACAHAVSVLAVEDANCEHAVAAISQVRPEVIVIASFGQILRTKLLHLAPFGCVNVHFSLLPELRGPAPVAWAIIRGFPRTGVTIMKVVRKMDAGAILAQRSELVCDTDTTDTLSERLAGIGAHLLVDTLDGYIGGLIAPVEQDECKATYAPKITRDLGRVDWARPAFEVDRLIRGLSGQGGAWSFVSVRTTFRVAFYNSAKVDAASPGPGIAARGPHGELLVGAGAGSVEISEIQAEGKKRLSGKDFANGYHIVGGERFSSVQ